MTTLFDSHAHYDDHRFDEEFEGGTHGALRHVHEAGVSHIVNVGASLTSSANSVSLAEMYDFVYATVGIHPYDAQEVPAAEVGRALYRIEEMAKHEKVRAIGEIGLDYHYDEINTERQAYFFEAQLAIAQRLSLPVVIHSRDAQGDTLAMLAKHPETLGVLHSFSGSAEVARQLSSKGWYISFSGPVTYKNAVKVKEAAAVVPDDKILIETDCPYLPPVPHRGELNHSGYLKYTCQVVADLRGRTFEEMAALTSRNAMTFFGISR